MMEQSGKGIMTWHSYSNKCKELSPWDKPLSLPAWSPPSLSHSSRKPPSAATMTTVQWEAALYPHYFHPTPRLGPLQFTYRDQQVHGGCQNNSPTCCSVPPGAAEGLRMVALCAFQQTGVKIVQSKNIHWIKDFLTDRFQRVRVGPHVSPAISLSTSSPQGFVLSPLLYTRYTHDLNLHSSQQHHQVCGWYHCGWTLRGGWICIPGRGGAAVCVV